MTTVAAAILAAVESEREPLVGRVLTNVARDQGVELTPVICAMWDLVEDGRLSYGADARLRAAPDPSPERS